MLTELNFKGNLAFNFCLFHPGNTMYKQIYENVLHGNLSVTLKSFFGQLKTEINY